MALKKLIEGDPAGGPVLPVSRRSSFKGKRKPASLATGIMPAFGPDLVRRQDYLGNRQLKVRMFCANLLN